jgi:hypothetical protein
MGRFEQIAAKVSALPVERQDVIADVIARAFDADLNPMSRLSPSQIEDLQTIMAEPADLDLATDEEVEAEFASC